METGSDQAQVTSAVGSRGALRVIILSFVACSVIGGAYILGRWSGREYWVDGVLRCFAFVCFMVAVHVWGYRLYRRQFIPVARAEASTPTADPVLLEYARRSREMRGSGVSWGSVVGQQVLAALFTSLILDGGRVMACCMVSVGVYWFAVLLGVMTRRRMTETDRVLVYVGFWPLMFVVAVAAHVVWAIKGL